MSDKKIINISVRRAEERDIPRMEELLADICRLHCEGRPDIFRPGRKYGAEELIKLFSDPDRLVLVADGGNGVIGYAICIIKKHENHPVLQDFTELYVDDLCVSPEYRGQGIGHKLFDEIKNHAASIGAHHIDLNVWAFNENAIKFYESLGMKPEKIIMELILDK
jgi:ribosomal protein S18 acetylase RimI-like enzyme